jgi:F-box protein 18 (helicase)
MGLLTVKTSNEFENPVEPPKAPSNKPAAQHNAGGINNLTPVYGARSPTTVQPEKKRVIEYAAQQLAIIHCDAPIVVARAKAGTGKTTTAVGFSEYRPHMRILYLAFAKANADEAKLRFPRNVESRTTHSLAYALLSPKKRQRLAHSWRAITVRDDLGGRINYRDAAVAHRILLTFFASRDPLIEQKHCIDALDQFTPNAQELSGGLHYAQHLWADMCDESGTAHIPHDAYLKQYAIALSKGNIRLNFDLVIFDEAQDANPVTAQIVEGLILNGAKALYLGDEHQSIYEFRGATNAMENLPQGAVVLPLQETWRFGAKVANVANTILGELKGETEKIIPLGKDGYWNNTDQYTLLSRTNSYLLTEAVGRDGKGIHWIGGIDKYRVSSLKDAWFLKAGLRNDIKDPMIKKFPSFEEMEKAGEDTNDKEISALVKLVQEHGKSIPGLCELLYKNAVPNIHDAEAEMAMTTAHRSKGLEFDHVKLANDFEFLEQVEDTLAKGDKLDSKMVQEINLLYVVSTRPRKTLYLDVQTRDWLQNLPEHRKMRAIGQARQKYQESQDSGRPRIPGQSDARPAQR